MHASHKGTQLVVLIFSSMLLISISASGKTIHVDDDVVGTNDGTSWENAYNFLQDALADANESEKPVEVRVAQGVSVTGAAEIQSAPMRIWMTTLCLMISSKSSSRWSQRRGSLSLMSWRTGPNFGMKKVR